ncbi:MAG: hypothetical protein NZ992_07335 [Candidatus Korarchaeum sp.]|nr:hypothetical protein [Candidatus Korarchaeum sp.]MDW8035776.1 hypothetical protein [Candidatus Korarchaeum sp.]
MRKLLLDSSFLLGLTEFSISMEDLLSLYPKAELLTTASVVSELSSLADRRARVALEVLRRYEVRVLSYLSDADSDLLMAAKELGCTVATLDLELRRRLLEDGVAVVYLRAGKKLVLDEPSKLAEES